MNSQTVQSPTAADEAAIRAIPFQMMEARNKGDGEAFAKVAGAQPLPGS